MQDVCLHISDHCPYGRDRVALGKAHGAGEMESGNKHEVLMVDRITFKWIKVLGVYNK